ncbi:MAG: carbohydrate ABC transporter permease [Peptostreptococcaceae bacterium]|nr:carbohydrate ABC transporter permease [Peptostreptococcaceae bacterium]
MHLFKNISRGRKIFLVCNFLLMAFVMFFTLYPFLYLIAQSFSSNNAVSAGQVTIIPIDFNLDTYKYVLGKSEFYRYYLNTIIYSAIYVVLAVFGTALLAYPLSKSYLRMNKFFVPFCVFTMYFSGGIIPNYILISKWLGLRDSMWAIILPGVISTFNLLVMKSFFAGLPEELEEAAKIDGLNAYQIFIKIIIPLSKPIIATMVLFYLVGMWNEWFNAFMYLDSKDKWPIALWIRQLTQGANSVDVSAGAESSQITATIKSASMVLTSLPIICVYPFVQRYFVQGMTIGAVKG